MAFEIFDFIDIILVGVFLYFVIQRLRTSQAFAVLMGLILLKIFHSIASLYGLYTLYWLLSHVFDSIFIFIFIIFQSDLRKALIDIGNLAFFKFRRTLVQDDLANEIITACLEMASRKVGALIVFERNVSLNDLIEREGQKIDAQISKRLIMNIFYHGSPLHDGAMIISHGRIAAAGCILPLAVAKGQNFGTRHRAALGITQDSDAAVLVVSEERGEISFALRGVLTRNLDREALEKVFLQLPQNKAS